MSFIERIRGVLLDVDGTLLDGDRAIPGAAEALARLRERGIAFRLTTNTTRRPRSATAAALREAGLDVGTDDIVIPASLARRRIVDSGRARAALFVAPQAVEDFEGVVVDETGPDWIVLGDLGAGFTFERLNRAFHLIRAGAALLALQKNRFWHAGKAGIVLDAGPFVAALEYATGVTAEIVGKPSPAFFDLALREISLSADQVLVVGDDVETDIAGGAAAGCRTALVRTGKFSEETLRRSPARPDLLFDSVASLLP